MLSGTDGVWGAGGGAAGGNYDRLCPRPRPPTARRSSPASALRAGRGMPWMRCWCRAPAAGACWMWTTNGRGCGIGSPVCGGSTGGLRRPGRAARRDLWMHRPAPLTSPGCGDSASCSLSSATSRDRDAGRGADEPAAVGCAGGRVGLDPGRGGRLYPQYEGFNPSGRSRQRDDGGVHARAVVGAGGVRSTGNTGLALYASLADRGDGVHRRGRIAYSWPALDSGRDMQSR